MNQYLIFSIDTQTYAIDINYIGSVVCAAELAPINNESDSLLGLLNLHGTLLPVLNIRKQLGLKSRELEPSDQIIVCNKGDMQVAIWVDRVIELHTFKASRSDANKDSYHYSTLISSVLEDHGQVYFILDVEELTSFCNIKQN